MMLGTLKVLTDAHTIHGIPTRKGVECFQNELPHERTLFITSDHFIANQVKLILNKLYVYSETTSQSYVNYDSTKDHISIAIGKSLHSSATIKGRSVASIFKKGKGEGWVG